MQPTINDYDGWRNSLVGQWFFEHVLQTYADESAKENGKMPGSLYQAHEDFAVYVRNAGHITGVEYVIHLDPFEDKRQSLKEANDENNGNGKISAG